MLTVKQLIEKLEALNLPDARVVTPGFDEGDYEDVSNPYQLEIIPHDNESLRHGGRHEHAAYAKKPGTVETAVVINFE